MAKQRLLIGLVALASLLVVGQLAEANTIKLTQGGGFSYGVGGEFKVTVFNFNSSTQAGVVPMDSDADLGGRFQTFCIEYNEHFSTSSVYSWVVNTEAVAGGVSSADRYGRVAWESGTGDPISPETAWLFTKFWNGDLTGYDYTEGAGRAESAGNLQQAIWYLEGEITSAEFSAWNSAHSNVAQDWVNDAHTAYLHGDWTGIGQVRVLNLYDATGGKHQDQLVIVPLPAASLAGFALLFGLAGVRRMRRRHTV
jgi:hypothetical protein